MEQLSLRHATAAQLQCHLMTEDHPQTSVTLASLEAEPLQSQPEPITETFLQLSTTRAPPDVSTQTPQRHSTTTLIICDSIIRNNRLFNVITHCIPGATVQTILNKPNQTLPTLPATVTKIVLHVGMNDTTRRESIRTMNEFHLLFNVLKACGKSIFISGPLPKLNRDIEQFSRPLQQHNFLQSCCKLHNFTFIDNFDLFWKRADLLKKDGVHPNLHGAQMLKLNLQSVIHNSTCT
uniref:SGNH hydrolase-type esterase domain-containing protein n=1 Tax=Gouania willdenowi TaxID=441366 RepID=A0A8C5DGL3_GOUWI